jgi:hypothetical protein
MIELRLQRAQAFPVEVDGLQQFVDEAFEAIDSFKQGEVAIRMGPV